jgi:hypothetical protein
MTQEKEETRKYSNEVKKHFLEIVSTYNKYQEMMDRKSDITEVAETLGGITEAACELAVNEGDDWFDKHTVKRNMGELTKLGKQFDKVALESKSLDQRLSGLYEDMGHILSRYYKMGEITEEQMKTRLGITEGKTIKVATYGPKMATKGINDIKDIIYKKLGMDWVFKTSYSPTFDESNRKSKIDKQIEKQYNPSTSERTQTFKITEDRDQAQQTASKFEDLLNSINTVMTSTYVNDKEIDRLSKLRDIIFKMSHTSVKRIVKESVNEGINLGDVRDEIEQEYDWDYVEDEGRDSTRFDFQRGNNSMWVHSDGSISGNIPNNSGVKRLLKKLKLSESITEAKKVPTKQEIIDYLVKRGNNPKDAKKMVDKQYDHVISAWKNASLPKMADVVSTLGMDEQFETTMNENFSDEDIEKIKQVITKQKKLIGLTPYLKKAGFKNIDFVMIDSVPPHIKIKQGNKTFLIVNKKYVDKPDFVIGDIAGGLDEGKYIEEGAMSDIDVIRQESPNLAVFIKSTLKAYPKLGKSKNTLKWLKDIYDDKMTEATHGYTSSDHVKKHNDEFKLAQKLVKKVGKDEMKFYDELETIHEKIGHPKYMMWLSAALRGYMVDMHRDSKIKNRAEAEEALFLLSK